MVKRIVYIGGGIQESFKTIIQTHTSECDTTATINTTLDCSIVHLYKGVTTYTSHGKVAGITFSTSEHMVQKDRHGREGRAGRALMSGISSFQLK